MSFKIKKINFDYNIIMGKQNHQRYLHTYIRYTGVAFPADSFSHTSMISNTLTNLTFLWQCCLTYSLTDSVQEPLPVTEFGVCQTSGVEQRTIGVEWQRCAWIFWYINVIRGHVVYWLHHVFFAVVKTWNSNTTYM